MTAPSYSVNLWAVHYEAGASISVGHCVLPASGQTTYTPGTAANRGTGRCHGIALTPASNGQGFSLQSDSIVPASVTGLGTGAATWVRTSSGGTPERVTSPSSGDDVIGRCDTDGNLFAAFGMGTEIAQGAHGVAFLNVKTDGGAIGDGATDDTAAIQACLTAAGTNSGTVWFPIGDYKTTSTLTVPHNITIKMDPGAELQPHGYGDCLSHYGTINGSTHGGVLYDCVRIVGQATAQSYTVTTITNATPAVATSSIAHGLSTGDYVELSSTGIAALNRPWRVTVLTPTTFSLDSSTASGAFSGTANVTRRPRAGIADCCSSFNTLYKCDVGSCTFGLVPDQAEECDYYACVWESNTYAQVWGPNSADFTPTANPQFIYRLNFHGGTYNGGLYGIALDGGVLCSFDGGNCNGQSIAGIRYAGMVAFHVHNVDFETYEGIYSTSTALISGTSSGGSSAVKFSGSSFGCTVRVGTFIAGTAVFKTCYFSGGSDPTYIIGGANSANLIFEDVARDNGSKCYSNTLPTAGRIGAAGNDNAKTFVASSKPTGAPISGVFSSGSNWSEADEALSSSPSTSGCKGWINTVAGYDTAAVFKAYGRILSRASKSVAGSSNVNLTAAEAAHSILEFTGALTGNIDVTIPAAVDGFEWALFNNTSGAYTLTIKVLGQTGFAVGQGKRATAYCNATDLVRLTADV